MISVENKVAFVTGGAGGIGLCMVKELLENGAKGVAIVDLSETLGRAALAEITSTFGNNKAIFIKTDVANKVELEEAFETTIKTYNQLDIVINNAGLRNEIDWEKTLDVNLGAVIRGSYLAMQKYLPKYKSEEEGVIINTSSLIALMTVPYAPIYSVTKHGVVTLGRSLGGTEFYEKYKVRVLTICPGVIMTSINPLVEPVSTKEHLFPKEVNQMFENWKDFAIPPEKVGQALIKIINEGKTGSVWVVDKDEDVYEVDLPNKRAMRTKK